jgi:hypothetical protein
LGECDRSYKDRPNDCIIVSGLKLYGSKRLEQVRALISSTHLLGGISYCCSLSSSSTNFQRASKQWLAQSEQGKRRIDQSTEKTALLFTKKIRQLRMDGTIMVRGVVQLARTKMDWTKKCRVLFSPLPTYPTDSYSIPERRSCVRVLG